VTSVAQVRALTRRGRTGRWLDWYIAGFGALLAGIYLGSFLAAPFSRLARGGGALPPGQAETGLALVIASGAALLLLAQALGPLTLSPADASWLLMSPLERRGVLRRPALAVAGSGVLAGAVLGALAFAMAGPYVRQVTPHSLPGWVALATVAGAGLGLTAVLVATMVQASEPARRVLRAVGLVIAGGAAFTAAGTDGGGLPQAVVRAVAGLSRGAADGMAVVAVVAATCGAALAWRRLRDFPAGVLWADSARAGRTRLAAAFLNVELLSWIAEDNHWRRRALRSRPWPVLPRGRWRAFAPAFALAWADWRRLARRRWTLVMLAASTVAPLLAAGAITGAARGVVTAAVLLIGPIAAASQGAAALRRDTSDATFRRLLGVARRPALAARAVLPSLLAAGWLAIALALLVSAGGGAASGGELRGWLWPLLGLLAGPGLAAAALRSARTAPLDATDTVGVDLPTGGAPPWLLTRLLSIVLGLVAAIPTLAAAGSALAATGPGHPGHSGGASGGGVHAGTLVEQALLAAVVLGCYLLIATSGD
jgi:hypothetical protein